MVDQDIINRVSESILRECSNDEWHLEDNNPRWPYDRYVRTYFGKPLRYEFVRQYHDLTLV